MRKRSFRSFFIFSISIISKNFGFVKFIWSKEKKLTFLKKFVIIIIVNKKKGEKYGIVINIFIFNCRFRYMDSIVCG